MTIESSTYCQMKCSTYKNKAEEIIVYSFSALVNIQVDVNVIGGADLNIDDDLDTWHCCWC